MRVYRGLEGLPKFNRAVATMGSFDGVHGGHFVLIQRVIARARELSGESIILTFDPHPRYVLGTDDGMQLLSTLEEKVYLLERAGVDNLVIIPFTKEFSRQTPAEFIENYLSKVGIQRLIVGYNHRFGHNKQGDYGYLERENNGLEIEMVEQQRIQDDKVSSTIIRNAILSGDMTQAAKLLSHPYTIACYVKHDGSVEKVEQEKLLPPTGEYTIRLNGLDGLLTIQQDRCLTLRPMDDKINQDQWERICSAEDKVILELI